MTTERWAAARTSAALRIVAGAVAAMLLVASCSGSPSAQHRRASSKAAAVSVYRALGSGTLYLLSGDPALGQVLEMQVRARKTRGLTSGMSWISASSRGLVLSDDRSGEGVFAVYHDGRVIDQPAGHVVTAAINDTGAVAYAEIPYSGGPWRLIVQPPESGHGTLLYRQALDIGDFVWGPRQSACHGLGDYQRHAGSHRAEQCWQGRGESDGGPRWRDHDRVGRARSRDSSGRVQPEHRHVRPRAVFPSQRHASAASGGVGAGMLESGRYPTAHVCKRRHPLGSVEPI